MAIIFSVLECTYKKREVRYFFVGSTGMGTMTIPAHLLCYVCCRGYRRRSWKALDQLWFASMSVMARSCQNGQRIAPLWTLQNFHNTSITELYVLERSTLCALYVHQNLEEMKQKNHYTQDLEHIVLIRAWWGDASFQFELLYFSQLDHLLHLYRSLVYMLGIWAVVTEDGFC